MSQSVSSPSDRAVRCTQCRSPAVSTVKCYFMLCQSAQLALLSVLRRLESQAACHPRIYVQGSWLGAALWCSCLSAEHACCLRSWRL